MRPACAPTSPTWRGPSGNCSPAPARSKARGVKHRHPWCIACRVFPWVLDAVIARAVSRHDREQFQSMAEFVLAWQAIAGAPGIGAIPAARRWTSSDRRLAARQLTMQAAAGLNPYRGLLPFTEADADGFFGRREMADALHATVRRSRFVAVVGASGMGKSSLVLAGLVPVVHEEGSVQIATLTPGDDPVAALHSALSEIALSRLDPGDPGGSLRTIAGQSIGGLLGIVDQFRGSVGRSPRPTGGRRSSPCWPRVARPTTIPGSRS